MKELVQFLARQLVNNPDAVEVRETQGETASVLELKVAKEDLGRIIGKQGRTAKSIRTILNAAASRTNRKVVLEIIEEQKTGPCGARHAGAIWCPHTARPERAPHRLHPADWSSSAASSTHMASAARCACCRTTP